MYNMDLHERYVKLPTVDISILQLLETSFQNDPYSILHSLVQRYNQEIVKKNVEMKKIETFRTILCYEYQLTFNSEKRSEIKNVTDLKYLCIENVERVFFPSNQPRDVLQVPILYDIILLQMLLYSDCSKVEECLIKFQTSTQSLMTGSNDTRALYIKIIECFVEVLALKKFLHQNKDEDLKTLSLIFLRDVKFWMTMNEDVKWKSLASILPKIIDTFGHENGLMPIWNFILYELHNYKESLSALCLLSDIYFPTEPKDTENLYELWITEKFWTMILRGMESSLQQHRKQAIFLLKRTIYSMSTLDKKHISTSNNSLIPFRCNYSCKTNSTITLIKDKFFLVLEALEEKQCHLVMPALSNIPNLLKASYEHIPCGNCFNIIWIRCLFKRILCHENNNIVKWGLIQVCKINTEIYDEKFLELFAKTLNNTYLYECQNKESQPEIVTALTELFTMNHEKSGKLLSTFLVKISEISWGPVAIFYVTMAMEAAVSKAPIKRWHKSELEAIKTLVASSITVHSHILRMASQIQILKMIPNCFTKIDLEQLANTLISFPQQESFKRKGLSWNIITSWLAQVIPKADAMHFIEHNCEQYHYQHHDCEVSTVSFALMIFLLFDAKLIFTSKECRADIALRNWLQMLDGVDMRPYADTALTITIVKFLFNLEKFLMSGTCDPVNRLLTMYRHTILKFLHKILKKVAVTMCYENVKEYLELVQSFLNNSCAVIPHSQMYHYVDQFHKESIHVLQNVEHFYNMESLCALHILYYSQNIFLTVFKLDSHMLYTDPLRNMNKIERIAHDDQMNSKGKIVSECYLMLAKLTHQYLENCLPSAWYLDIDWLQNLLHLFELGGMEIVSTIAKTLQILITGNSNGFSIQLEDLNNVFDVCWRYTLLQKKNRLYWEAIKDLMGAIINPNLLQIPDSFNLLNQFVDTILKEADNLPQLKKILLTHLELLPSHALKNFQETLLICTLHGYVPRRDKRIENAACLHISKYLTEYYSEQMSLIEEHNIDATVRAHAVVLLHKLITQNIEFASTFLPLVLTQLEKDKNKRYFRHSQLHRLKNRILQILLILEPVVNEEGTIQLQETICNLILIESNQHSVRLMQEWLLVRIFTRNAHLHDKLWMFFEQSILTRPACTSSAVSIVYHVAQLLPTKIQHAFLKMGISYIARCCLGHQFNMRLYGQMIFIKLYKLLSTANNLDVMLEYKGLYNAVINIVQQGKLAMKSVNIQDDFYFSVFDPVEDYSLQTIYFELPRLCDMEFDEWIAPNLFKLLKFIEFSSHPLKLLNPNQLLKNHAVSINFPKDDKNFGNQSVDTDIEGLDDIQKKIVPSKCIVSFNDETFFSLSQLKSETKEGLIVVASLVDRCPNLGGLARTCEIFGVTELVIANLTAVKDKEFQNLSVSAEKWINISEVKQHELQKYLLEKKSSGWTLFGVEQTANSTNLVQIKFPRKSILVLGNEKDGIPPNLIPLFDTCMEIPQLGIIRSLNVHVTGAICIWHYINQYALAGKS